METPTGLILKEVTIILLEILHQEAIELAQKGSHSRLAAMVRRLEFHFFSHDMRIKTDSFLQNCLLCSTFSSNKTAEPIKRHSVPSKCWEIVAVNLFRPMSSSKHVMVVQDLGSRFPAARPVSSTGVSRVLIALGGIYDTYKNSKKRISDNLTHMQWGNLMQPGSI